MKIVRRCEVPTGDILVVEGAKGKLEMLSVGDYGKNVNLKADFLGLDREPEPVIHRAMLPLSEKWVITISTQYGCSMNCPYCDVPDVGPGRNASFDDLVQQVLTGIHLHPEVTQTARLNIHFARMGEPSWNPYVLDAARWMKEHIERGDDGQIKYKVHPVVSTMMPRDNQWLKTFVHTWMRIKNRVFEGNAGLQLSINSTDELERQVAFGGNAHTLLNISRIMEGVIPFGRKITLNFALADYEIDPDVLLRFFEPERYVIKLTPMHKTVSAQAQDIKTEGDYTTYAPYSEHEKVLKQAGYDVIVFIASREEDEGRITCGNAILRDRMSTDGGGE